MKMDDADGIEMLVTKRGRIIYIHTLQLADYGSILKQIKACK